MAFMSARIGPTPHLGGVTALAKTLGDALFSDPKTEIELAKMRSQMMEDAYRRETLRAQTELYNAKTATEQYNLEGRQGMVPALQQFLYGAQGPEPAAPAPVDLSGPETGMPIPLPRPELPTIDQPGDVSFRTTTEPDIQISPTNYPLRSEADMYTYGPEPDMRFGSSGMVNALPSEAPVPVRRPGDWPPFKPGLGYLQDVPPDLMPGAQAAPTTMPEPREPDQRREIVTDPVYSTFGDRPPIPLAPGAALDPSNFFSSSLQGLRPGMGPALPNYTPPPSPTLPEPAPVEPLPTLPSQGTGRYPQDFPLFTPDEQLTGTPLDLQSLAAQLAQRNTTGLPGIPPELMPAPVSAVAPRDRLTGPEPTYPSPTEVPPYLDSASVEVPGRPQPPAPPPAQPGGPAVTVPGRTTAQPGPFPGRPQPPPVSPNAPLSPNAFPITATGDLKALVEPETQTVVIQDGQGGGTRLTFEQAGALANGLVAASNSANDLAAGTGKMAGLIGLQSGNLSPDQQRIAAMEYTGTLPGTGTMITSQDTAPGVFEAQKAAATEAVKPDEFKDIMEGKPGEFFRRTRNPDGSIKLERVMPDGSAAAGTAFELPNRVPDVEGTGEGTSNRNFLAEVSYMHKLGETIPPELMGIYSAVFQTEYGPKLTVQTTEKGPVTQRIVPDIPSNIFKPEQLGATTTSEAAAAAAASVATQAAGGTAQPPAAAPTAAPAETGPAVPAAAPAGGGKTVKAVEPRFSTVNGKQVKNWGGWLGDGEVEQPDMLTEGGPGGTAIRTNYPSQQIKAMSEVSQQGYDMMTQAIRAARYLDNHGPGDIPSAMQTAFQAISDAAAEGGGSDILWSTVMNKLTTDETKNWARALFTFMNAQLRPDTGAAISNKEFTQYAKRFAMQPGEGWAGYDLTRQLRNDAMRGMRISLAPQVPASLLKQLDLEMANQGLDLEWKPPTDGTQPPAGGQPAAGDKKDLYWTPEGGLQ